MESKVALADVCQSLDKVTEEFFATLESLYLNQAQLEAAMRGGFLSLSRARYCMGGPRSVGALQFAGSEMEMEAVTMVTVSADGDCNNGGDVKNSWTKIEMDLLEKQTGGVTKTAEKKKPDTHSDLRLRKATTTEAGKGDEGVESVGTLQSSASSGDSTKPKDGPRVKDPLTLFGVLVSPHLRRCQSSFKQAASKAIEIANLKNKLQGLQLQFQQLLKEKHSVTASGGQPGEQKAPVAAEEE